METGADITSLFTKPKLTPGTITNGAGSANSKQETPPEPPAAETQADHPITQLLDFAVHAAVPICTHNGLEPPAVDTYESFTRDAVNEAAWEYMPCTNSGELPKWVVLIIAIVGMILVFMPTGLSILAKKAEAAQLAEQQEEEEQEAEIPDIPERSYSAAVHTETEDEERRAIPETAIVGL